MSLKVSPDSRNMGNGFSILIGGTEKYYVHYFQSTIGRHTDLEFRRELKLKMYFVVVSTYVIT